MMSRRKRKRTIGRRRGLHSKQLVQKVIKRSKSKKQCQQQVILTKNGRNGHKKQKLINLKNTKKRMNGSAKCATSGVEKSCSNKVGDKNNENPKSSEKMKIITMRDFFENKASTRIISELISESESERKSNISEEEKTYLTKGRDKENNNEELLEKNLHLCPICGKELDSFPSLTSHIKQHHPGSNAHTCLLCGKTLSSSGSLDRHMLVHSGERPFKCKVCTMSFTTNGNMHRHMRTHGDAYETHELSHPIKDKHEIPANHINLNNENSLVHNVVKGFVPEQEQLHCPVCGKAFLCKYGLHTHMEAHPNDPIRCHDCGRISDNYSKHIGHHCEKQEIKQNIINTSVATTSVGFLDLTFTDFSTDKFSLIAKAFCERQNRHPSSAFHTFECSKCLKAFPCGSALKLHNISHEDKFGTYCPSCNCDFQASSLLQFHQLKHRSVENCVKTFQNSEVSNYKEEKQNVASPEMQSKKEDFLALFELQNKKSHFTMITNWKTKPDQGREENFENFSYFIHGKPDKPINKSLDSDVDSTDFADIQSIIALASKTHVIPDVHASPVPASPASPLQTSFLPQSPLPADSANASPETPSKDDSNHPSGKNTDSGFDSPVNDESGEFICQTCCQTFKSINALKRHNRSHNQGGISYSCHMCSYKSLDKSTLIRHLRTHNGERPFQCSVCKYAFTTKANCERHVRKRHKKFTKNEIQSIMQYNPDMEQNASPVFPIEISNIETVCKYCNVDFKFNRVLRHHLRSLHNSCNRKPFFCNICRLGFSTKNNCIRHVLKQHPNMKDNLGNAVSSNSQNDSSNNFIYLGEDRSSSSHETIENSLEPINLSIPPLISIFGQSNTNTVHSEDVVNAAKSLVSLAYADFPQEEPLDLAVHAIDLTMKSPPEENIVELSVYPTSSTLAPSEDISLSALTEKTKLQIKDSLNNQMHHSKRAFSRLDSSNISSKTSAKIVNSKLSSIHRPFICEYCSTSFTLKSNMERHIKKKHPEYARPARSRNFIPTFTSRPIQQRMQTLSEKTRDALREVLSNKSNSPHEVSSDISVVVTHNNHETIPKTLLQPNLVEEKDVSKGYQLLDLTNKSSSSCYNVPSPIEELNCGNNTEVNSSADLASVSSVIDTANSQEFKRYLKTAHDEEKSITENKKTSGKNKSLLSSSEPVDLTNATNPVKKKLPYVISASSVSCPFCSRKFPWTSSLRRHILTHTGQKPYKCPRCPVWFTTKSNCERHLSRKHGHIGELITRAIPDRPYKCNVCHGSTFSTQGNLRKHYYLKHWTKSYMAISSKASETNESAKSYEKPDCIVENSKDSYICGSCNKVCNNFQNLVTHIDDHMDLIYKCHLCDASFTQRQECINHYINKHKFLYQEIQNVMKEKVSLCSDVESNAENNNKLENSEDTSFIFCAFCFHKVKCLNELSHHMNIHMGDLILHQEFYDQNLKCCKDINIVKDNQSEAAKSADEKMAILCIPPLSEASPSEHLHCNQNVSLVSSSTFTSVNEKGGAVENQDADLSHNLLRPHDLQISDEILDSAD